jgi:hypothetical protein
MFINSGGFCLSPEEQAKNRLMPHRAIVLVLDENVSKAWKYGHLFSVTRKDALLPVDRKETKKTIDSGGPSD